MRAWGAIDNGVTAQTAKTRQKYWHHWKTYVGQWKQDCFLENNTEIERGIILTAFAARVRSGFYGRGTQVKVPTVQEALAAISKTAELAGKPSPVYKYEENYILPVQRCIEGMRRNDPPSIPQLAVPISVPLQCYKYAYEQSTISYREKATADLALIAFFYLLRVGEYTSPRKILRNNRLIRTTRTIQFRTQDVGFWKQDKQLDRNSSLEVLLTADSATLKISNQKNGKMGQTIHQEGLEGEHSPVKALARRIHHILANSGNDDTLLCMYSHEHALKAVTPMDMIQSIRRSVKTLKLDEAGIDPDIVGVHSLRAGGAMALKLHGESNTTIMKHGRWSGLTFLQYIHNQIGHLSKDLSKKMARPVPFKTLHPIRDQVGQDNNNTKHQPPSPTRWLGSSLYCHNRHSAGVTLTHKYQPCQYMGQTSSYIMNVKSRNG